MLERADVPLRTVEFFWIEVGAVVAAFMISVVIGGSLPVMLLLMVVAGSIPYGWSGSRCASASALSKISCRTC